MIVSSAWTHPMPNFQSDFFVVQLCKNCEAIFQPTQTFVALCYQLTHSPASSALVEESSSSSWKKSIIVLLPGLLFHHNDCWVPVFVKRSLLHRLNFSLLAKVVALRGGGLGGLGRHWFLTSIAKYSQLASSTLMSLENPKWDRSFALDFEHRRQHENVPL